MIKQLKDSTYKCINDDRISIVKVHAKWCGPCKLLKPHYKKWEKKFNVYNGTEIRYYEVDGDKCKKFKKKYEIDRYPTILYLVYGVVVYKQFGMTTEVIHENLIKETLKVRYEHD